MSQPSSADVDSHPSAKPAGGSHLERAIESYAGPDAETATTAAMVRMDVWRTAGWEVAAQVWDGDAGGPTTLEQFAYGEESLLVRDGGRLVVTYMAPPGTSRPLDLPLYVAPAAERWSGYLQYRMAMMVVGTVIALLILVFVILPAFSRAGMGNSLFGGGRTCHIVTDNPAAWTMPPEIPEECSGGYSISQR